MNSKLWLFAALAAVCVFGTPAAAAPYQVGDVFASVGRGKVKVFRPDGTFVQTLDTTLNSFETTGGAFDSSGNYHVTSFTNSNMSKFDNNGNLVLPAVFAANDANSHNESVVFDAAGNMYIGQADGTRDIIKRNASGTFLQRFNVATGPRGSDWIDLAGDQRTIFYTSEGRVIRRYDTSTDTQLADFAILPGLGNSFALRLLSGGGLLVADRNDVKRLDAAGNVVQTYDTVIPGDENFFFALNLDPDGTSFWTAGITSGQIYRFDIASGMILTTFNASVFTTLAGLSIFGEITEGTPMPEPAIPFLVLVCLGVFSLIRRKKTA